MSIHDLIARSVAAREGMSRALRAAASRRSGGGFVEEDAAPYVPRTDVVENRREIRVLVELPGVDEHDVRLEARGNRLTVRGRKPADPWLDEGLPYFRERYAGEFRRAIILPCEIDGEAARVSFERGVLQIVLPKRTEGALGVPAVQRVTSST